MEHHGQVAALRRALPQDAGLQVYEFIGGPAGLDNGDEPIRTVKLSGLFSAPSRPLAIYHGCTASSRPSHARCVLCGSMEPTVWRSTSILHLSRRRIPKHCAIMRANAAGTIYVCLVRVRARLNMILAAKTRTAARIPRSRFSDAARARKLVRVARLWNEGAGRPIKRIVIVSTSVSGFPTTVNSPSQ
jgi:hypothetical protein